VRGAGAVSVDDRGQPLYVSTQYLGERLPLGLAQLRKLLGDVRHRTVMLAEFYSVDGTAHLGGGGGISGLRQCSCHAIDSGFNVIGPLVYSRKDGVDAAPREGVDGIVAADFAQLAHGRGRQVVVGVAHLGAPRRSESVAAGGPATAVVLPGGGRAGLRFAGVQQGVEVSAHACSGDAEPIADLACSDGPGLQQELDNRATGVAFAGCRRRSGSINFVPDFHNTIVTEFRNPVKPGDPYVGHFPTAAVAAAAYYRHVTEQNRRIVLAQRPTGLVDDSTTRVESEPVPEPADGEALVRVRYLSIDPTIRTWMDDVPSYLPPIQIDEVIRSGGVGEVVQSRSADYQAGQLVFGMTGWQDYVIADSGDRSMQVLPDGVPPGIAIGILGVTGMTAYFGMIDVGQVTGGDVVVVSGAAGATGSAAGQIAKVKGAKKVVGIAGGAEKCAYIVDELGFDEAIDYKNENIAARLRDSCPDGVDLYFDNVGGSILNACLANLAIRGRVVLCGAISSYNSDGPPPGPSNYLNLLVRRGRMEGFIILDYLDRFPTAQLEMAGWIAEGKIKSSEHLVEGLENAPDALNLLFSGGNTGKVIVAL
jgi:NADPH-dependent curcumin reductase